MNEIKIFENEEFGAIRTMSDQEGQTWFCGKDVCDALGYKQTHKAVDRHVDEGDGMKCPTPTTSGEQLMRYVNESGLYALILGSKLDSARRFKHWVTSEVLPAIRRDGGYMVARAEESNEMIMARALKIVHSALVRKEEELSELRPKAEYADEVLDSVSCFTTTQIAKGMGMTAVELNVILCFCKIQYRQSGQFMLYAPYARQGLAQNRTFAFYTSEGELVTHTYLVWTERGRRFVHELINKPLLPKGEPISV